MLFSPSDIERAEQYLEPLCYLTGNVQVSTAEADDPTDAGVRIIYKAFAPTDQQGGGADPVLLCVHDLHQSGQVFEPLALALAEQGLMVAALSLAWHGSGRWFSYAGRPLAEESLARYSRQVHLVTQTISGSRPLVIAGNGLLGGLLAQMVARENASVAGLALLGGCLPPLIDRAWQKAYPAQARGWWQQQPALPSASALPPPDRAFIQTWWLDETANEEASHIWPYLCAETPQLAEDFAALAGQSFSPPTTPALIIAGERDAILTREALQETAAAYQTPLTLISDAPHLLVRSRQLPTVVDHLANFCRGVVPPSPLP